MAKIRGGLLVEVIDPVPVELDWGELLRVGGARFLKAEELAPLMEKCLRLIEPKAVFAFVEVVGIGEDEVRLEGGHVLRSVVLSDLLECGQVVAPYVVTIGSSLEKAASEEARGSILREWILEKVGDYALEKVCGYVRSYVGGALGGAVSSFDPGGGTGRLFGIEQQEVIFQILDPAGSIGVRLTSGCMMVPRKSVSGVLAATRQEYVACQYCPRERCESRGVAFSGEYYLLKREGEVD